MLCGNAFYLRDARSQVVDDGGFTHDIHETRAGYVFAICSYQGAKESSLVSVSISTGMHGARDFPGSGWKKIF
jgi:hypothetical protein